MEPADTLRRIAFLLEAENAETYKVRAFRRAAAVVSDRDLAELSLLGARNRLESLEGVGKSTAKVISEALSGSIPLYLQELEDRAPDTKQIPSSELLDSLRGDCHSHSDWSDGSSSIEEMARTAAGLGRSYQALTDHSPRLMIAHGLSSDDLRRQIEVVDKLNGQLAPFRLLTGIEVDILDDGALDQDENLLARLDVVVASVHSKLRMEAGPMTKRMIAAVQSPHVDILGHCTGRLVHGRGRPQSDFDHEAVFSACAKTDTAVEINCRPDRRDPPRDLLETALSLGCRFSIDTDAHAPGQLSWLALGCDQALEAGVSASSVVNAMELDEFLRWTGSHEQFD